LYAHDIEGWQLNLGPYLGSPGEIHLTGVSDNAPLGLTHTPSSNPFDSYTLAFPAGPASGASFLGTTGAGGTLSFIAAGKTVTIEYIEADGKTVGQLIFTNGLLTNYY